MESIGYFAGRSRAICRVAPSPVSRATLPGPVPAPAEQVRSGLLHVEYVEVGADDRETQVAAARQAGAERVLSEDLQTGQIIESVLIENPLVE